MSLFSCHEISDALIIGVVIVVNAVVGVIQEGKAQKALDSLKKLTSPHAVVRRDGVVKENFSVGAGRWGCGIVRNRCTGSGGSASCSNVEFKN